MSGSTNTHSKLSPSGAKRWSHCTASNEYLEQNAHRIPEERESPYAAEGTRAHDYAEAVLLGKLQLEDVPSDFRPYIKVYVDECKSHATAGGIEYVEAKVPLFYRPEDTGTVDFAYITEDAIFIIDLKYGAGVAVDAEENDQLAIYARSLVDDLDMFYDFKGETKVSIRIVQPRHHGKDPVSIWDITVAELRDYTTRIGEVAEAIQNGGETMFAPSEDACRWCPAKGFCTARLEKALEALPAFDLEDEAPYKVDAKAFTDEHLVKLYKQSKYINKVLSDVADYLEDRALAGDPAAGTKVVAGREGNRAWVDELAAERFLANKGLKQSERLNMTVISPAAAEKLLDEALKVKRTKKSFESLITRSQGKLTLALAEDKRPAVMVGLDALDELDNEEADSDFDNLLG